MKTLRCSAASGLFANERHLFVVADDEVTLEVYDRVSLELVRTVNLVDEVLSDEPHERKRGKPDFESITALPDGRLLVLGSGSTPRRRRGVTLCSALEPVVIDFGPLFAALSDALPDLNLEGAAVSGDRLLVFQRGNGAAGRNALISLDLAGVLSAIDTSTPVPASVLMGIQTVDLGALDGVPLGFTDAFALSDGQVLYSAAAEDGGSTFFDGACKGCVLGLLDAQGTVIWQARLDVPYKIEGLWAGPSAAGPWEIFLVADPDDRTVFAPLHHLPFSVVIR
ncbi:MAG: hypothetical protein EXR76_01165 [Myxococcales bacterium]|nr:hypothetical protein [Myxococcales bacterium]